jgi:hypothetical protein
VAQEVHALGLDLAVEGHLLDPLAPLEEPAKTARIDDCAREDVRTGLLALFEHRNRHVSKSLGQLGRLLDQLPEADGAREPGRPRADDEDADLDPLLW